MGLTKIFSTTTHGCMIIIGNTLGLSGPRNNGDELGSIGAFITSDLNKQVPTYPFGTTSNWLENSSFAIVTIPSGATILRAQLSWGGTEIANAAGNVTPFVDNSIKFITPSGSSSISPDSSLSDSFTFTNGLNKYYSRSQDVTSLIVESGSYSVASVPAVVAPDGNAITCAGWSLAIIYELQSLPPRNMSLFTGIYGIQVNAPDIILEGFLSPTSGSVDGWILVSALEGDSGLVNDSLLFGPDSSNLVTLSGPNNAPTNFFSSQINIADPESPNVGILDKSGSFGNLNSTSGSFPPHGVRQGFDITSVLSTNFSNAQRSAAVRISTSGDAYAITMLGLQLDAVIPKPFNCSYYGYRVAVPNGHQNSELTQVNLVTGKNTVINSDLGFNINAIGYSTLDNFIYGLKNGSTHLLLIDKDGLIINYGQVPNLPVYTYNVGAIDNQGHLFVKNSISQIYYVIDVNQNSPTFGTLLDPTNSFSPDVHPYGTSLSQNIPLSDWTFRKSDMHLYGINQTNGQLVSINPLDGNITPYTTSGLPISAYGSMYSLSDDFIYAVSNLTGYIYRISISGNTADSVYFSKDIISSQNDGASCLNATLNLDFGDAPDTSSENNTNNYSTLLENNGPRHLIINNLTLGSKITSEINAHQNYDATGDDLSTLPSIYDDGIITPLPSLVTTDSSYNVDVVVNNNTGIDANLYGWLDFNQNGIFEAAEGFTSVIHPSSFPQIVTMTFLRPSGYTTNSTYTFLRVRLTTDTLTNTGTIYTEDSRSIGPASDGEVEDYIVNVSALPPNCPLQNAIYTNINTSYSGNILANDPQSQVLSYSVNTPPSNGILNLNSSNGNYLYTPNNNFLGNDFFKVYATNSSGLKCIATVSISVISAILDIKKLSTKSIVSVPGVLTYEILVTNKGNTDALNVIITDLLQSETSYVPNTLLVNYLPSSYIPDTGIDLGTIPKGLSSIIHFDVNVNTLPQSEQIKNTPTGTFKYIVNPHDTPISSSTIGNTTTVNVKKPSLKITKSVNTNYASLNEVITYILFVENNGNINLDNIIVKDLIPNGLHYIDNTLTVEGYETNQNPSNGVFLNTISPGNSITIIFNTSITSIPSPNPAINNASATFNYQLTPSSNPISGSAISNNVSTEIRFADLNSDGNFVKDANIDYADIGDIITYTITLLNTGTVDALDVVVVDTIPNSATLVPHSVFIDTIPSTDNPQTGILVNTLYPNKPIVITFDVKINTLPIPNPIKNVAIVNYKYLLNPDIPIIVNTIAKTNIVYTKINSAKLIISKFVDTKFATINDILTYTILVKNIGNTVSLNTILKDLVPDGLSFNYGSLSVDGVLTGEDPNVSVNLDKVSPDETITIIFTAIVNKIPIQNPIENIATTSYKYIVDINTIPISQTSTSTIVQTYINYADLNSPGNFVKTGDRYFAALGDTITYTLTVQNTGNTIAQNVTITDIIPGNTIYVASSLKINNIPSSDIPSSGIYINSIDINDVIFIKFKVIVASTPPNKQIDNVASLVYSYKKSPLGESVTNNCISNTFTTYMYNTLPSVSISKTADTNLSTVGGTVHYSVKIENNGSVTLSNVIVNDLLPSPLKFVNYSLTIDSIPNQGANIINGVSLNTMYPNDFHVIEFDALVVSSDPNKCINTAKVVYKYHLPYDDKTYFGTNISNQHILDISENINSLDVVKSANKINVSSGEIVTFSINIVNNSTNDIVKAIFKDHLDKCFLDLIQDSFMIHPDKKLIIDYLSLLKGIDIGPIISKSTVTISFDVKIKTNNCLYNKHYSILNKVTMEVIYKLSDNSITTKSKDSNTVILNKI